MEDDKEIWIAMAFDNKKFIDEVKNSECVGEAGAGMVKVTIKGLTITKVEIDKDMFTKTMPEVLEDFGFMAELFKAAANQAIQRANEQVTDSFLDKLGYSDGRY